MFSYSPTEADTLTVLKGIAAAITDEKFTASVDETNEFLNIAANDIASNNVLILSENLTTETVTSIITFGTEESGDILIPDGVITNIVNAEDVYKRQAQGQPDLRTVRKEELRDG